MPRQDDQFDLDKILARASASTLETLHATADVERELRDIITAAANTQRERRQTRRVFRRCIRPVT